MPHINGHIFVSVDAGSVMRKCCERTETEKSGFLEQQTVKQATPGVLPVHHTPHLFLQVQDNIVGVVVAVHDKLKHSSIPP